jgi:hypothetical protein
MYWDSNDWKLFSSAIKSIEMTYLGLILDFVVYSNEIRFIVRNEIMSRLELISYRVYEDKMILMDSKSSEEVLREKMNNRVQYRAKEKNNGRFKF